jgi:DNA-binding MarR family transcriptional regulator
LSNVVNLSPGPSGSPEALLQTLLESALAQLRPALYGLSDELYPGFRARHYRLLSFIPQAGVRVSDIADSSGLSKQALAQALALVRIQGCVDVIDDPGDRRARLVVLTDRGREALQAVRERTTQTEKQWAARVGAERYAIARAVLAEIAGGTGPEG